MTTSVARLEPQTKFERQPLFKAVRDSQWPTWAKVARCVDHQKGHVILTQDDMADWFYIVQSGWVKLYRETIDGGEVILDLLNHGHVFGETSYFLDKKYPFSVETLTPCSIWILPQSLLTNEIQNNPSFAIDLMTHMAKTQTRRDKDLEHHTAQNAAQRLGCFIMRLCGDSVAGAVTITLPLDKHVIANYLGMKPETFSRTLAKLADDVGVKIDGDTIHIPRLHDVVRYTCQACSNVFPCEK